MTQNQEVERHEERRESLARELGEPVTCDRLTRDFVMFQRRRGHRHSTDDLLTAWYGVTHLPKLSGPARLLDLGTGIGSIGLAVLWVARQLDSGARLTAIEAQELSYRFLRENVEANGVDMEVATIHGDLREPSLLPEGETFDLITGSPPYFDVRAGIVSADSQRAHARFELRGDVRDYARAAAARLGDGGRFVFCFPAVQKQRAEDACKAAGLTPLEVCDVIPKEGLVPLFTLFAYIKLRQGESSSATVRPRFVVRDRHGLHTSTLVAAQACFGLGSDRNVS